MEETLSRRIIDSNIAMHRNEAPFYDLIHAEIFNKHEQERLCSVLRRVDSLVEANNRIALDFGAGTGNITGKLLDLGYRVTAVDISAEMLEALKNKYSAQVATKRVSTITGDLFTVVLDPLCDKFDLITSYSVLHHLPDYAGVVRRLASLLKKGGVMYLDHEWSPNAWNRNLLERLMTNAKDRIDYEFNQRYLRKISEGRAIPKLDYDLVDYWDKKEHYLDHAIIGEVFKEMEFASAKREDYHLNRCVSFNPFYYFCKGCCKPDVSLWVAKK